jgi:hypothetical protein
MQRYAVLLSGGIDWLNNHPRYLNDLRLAYSVLVDHYGFDKDKVFVAYADGTATDLDGDGQNDIFCPALPADLQGLLVDLSTRMTPDDFFFLLVSNHGDRTVPNTMQVYLWLWDEESITDEELADLLDRLPGRAMLLVFGQCYSGSLIATLAGPNRVICTACAWDEVSWARPGRVYDEFLYHFLSTLRGQTPEGGSVPHNQTIREAFLYARAQDSRPEHPQYSDPSAIGSRLTLHGLP